ncbi:MAG TPA: hypothetical protein VNA15_07045 [Candidatus Angelobacter sp.]|nr:hypothetical protein [Candidatus Angelobacter sp.]
MSKPDLQALVNSRIAEVFQAAIEKVGRTEFEAITGVDDSQLASIIADQGRYVPVAMVTVACEINRSHGDPNPAHSSLTEALKGTTIRMPTSLEKARPKESSMNNRRRVPSLYRDSRVSRTQGGKSFRLLGFSVNTITFLLLGYFLGGVLISPILGQPFCTGIGTSPPSLIPCTGSVVGIILGAVGGLGYTYYYFVKRL